MDVPQFINEVIFPAANFMLDVVFLVGGLILLLAYPVHFFTSNLKKYTKEHKSRELLSHTIILILVFAILAAIWILPEIIVLVRVWFQKLLLREELRNWSDAAWKLSSYRWLLLSLVFVGIAYLLGHKHGKNRWLRSALGIIGTIIFGWLVNFWMGILFLSVPMIVAYYYALHDLALIVMPASNPEDKIEQKKRINAFISYTWGTQSPMTVVDSHAWKQYDHRIPGDFAWSFSDYPIPILNKLDRPGVIWTQSHQAVAISGGTQFKRIEPPGISFLNKLERLDQVFDLRMQLRTREIEVISKDGIRFTARYFTAFRIDNEYWDHDTYFSLLRMNSQLHGANKLSCPTGSFPFSHKRVQAALAITSTKAAEGNSIVHWDRWAMNVIEDQTRKVISQKNLDELWRPANDYKFANALDIIAEEIKKNSAMTLRAVGILLIVARVVNFSFPFKDNQGDEIARQQIVTWGSEWERKSARIIAEAEAEAERAQQEARAYAESLLLNSIAEGLQKTHEINPELPRHVIAMRFLSSLQDYVHKQISEEDEEEEEGEKGGAEAKRRAKLSRYFKDWQEMFFPGHVMGK